MNAIETIKLRRTFGERIAVDDLTLTVPRGSVFGFLGPNGAGKTTTVRMLTALIGITSGTAVVAGHKVGVENEAVRQSVGILTETPGMYERLSAWQNLLFFARLYDLPEKKATTQVEHYLRLMDLWERRNDRVGSFSKGMQQKLAIARSFLHEPQVVFLDEPTVGLDPEATRVVREFIKELRSEGRTIFLTTHNLPEADEMCDMIGVFRTHLLKVDTPAHLRTSMFGHGTRIRVVGRAEAWIMPVQQLSFVHTVTAEGNSLSVMLANPDEQNPALVQALVTAGAQIRTVEPIQHSLEEIYLELIDNKDVQVRTK